MSWLKVGELARKTGVSVRTLHYYEQLELLCPSQRTESGHRLYGQREVERLLRIKTLQHLGFGLETIASMLDDAMNHEIVELCAQRLAAARAVLEQERQRVELLERLSVVLGDSASFSSLITAIEALIMYEKHYTSAQLEQLARRREQLSEEGLREVQAQWERLFKEVEEFMARGILPEDERCAPLAKRWRELVARFTGGDAGIAQSLDSVWEHEGDALQAQHGYAPAVMEFASKMQQTQKLTKQVDRRETGRQSNEVRLSERVISGSEK